MKMAKASDADLEMAMELCGVLDGLAGRSATVPEAIERPAAPGESELFDRDDGEQCMRVLQHLLALSERANLARVVWGCAVTLSPRNQCVDPNSNTIEHHPATKAGLDAQKARPRAEWHEDTGAVLWWSFPVNEPPWVGQPTDSDWPGDYLTHWTPLIVPGPPQPQAAEAQPVPA